ncbi:MAG: ACP S-malonyltransferase [Pseudomonadaceae bacterium]|nr:ACP S-malonyltransferase [Pseudomonadaceae bacterium]
MKAFVFPGQGSQQVGMAAGFMAHAATRELFEQADDALGMHLARLMREGSEEELRATHNAQPALLLAGYAAARYVVGQSGKALPELAGAVAGHSLGEYTAVCVAGGMGLVEALQCVRLRGEAMTRAVPQGQGGMCAVLGLEKEVLAPLAAAHGVTVANDNAPGQLILSGPLDGLAAAEVAAKEAGAKRVLRLNVAGPFHTAAMQPAAEAVAAFLAAHPLAELAVPCTMNATAAATRAPQEVAGNLVAQITSPVRWRESMAALAEVGVTQVVELGCGKVLTGLAPRCDARLAVVALDGPETADAWLEAVLG